MPVSVFDEIPLSRAQKKAVKVCSERLIAREPVTRLFGYAGTGKTTIAKAIAEELDGEVIFGAYTGKAARVLAEKGCIAKTIHSLFYQFKNEQVVNGKKELLFDFRGTAVPPKAIILDEVSMIDEGMARDILSMGIPILAIGDPAQLPPVSGSGYFIDATPDILLEEVMRNGGKILELATDVRMNGPGCLAKKTYRRIVRPSIPRSEAMSYSQVLVGRNATRWAKNQSIRSMMDLGEGEFVAVGDRILCTSNNRQFGIFNGQQFTVTKVPEDFFDEKGVIALSINCECGALKAGNRCSSCGWIEREIPVWVGGFLGEPGEKFLRSLGFKSKMAMEAVHGYAITVHKAQGSEWESVLLVNESFCFRSEAEKWLYTAVTRAQEKLTVIEPR
jgi:exodeoxyribonuclease-5